ncbi:glycosyltransferase family 2 protein [Flammeovirga pectinis]|uniref:Glycosyltransferase family 2 protein n=1 Tax=Flammeovirga pectinis TaxID=2494373 RepID=A0A3S9PAM3_9BACT|nr:glycosyltransferase family 2 protein [Flammeovirga pectinis]AZQ65295.1 glycosyltransferase family 2 protein [Flammeovirga pectinis]
MGKDLISIITVNYKNRKITEEFLHSIVKLDRNDLEVIVIDVDPSFDNTQHYRKIFFNVIVIHIEENIGFSAANNLGIDISTGSFLYFTNNDTELTITSIDPLVTFLKNNDVGFISPKIKYYDSKNIIQYAGYTKVNALTGRNTTIGEFCQDEKKEFSKSYETTYIHGAAMMCKKALIEEVGKMPTEYFLYYEELDWSSKSHEVGKKNWYVGAAEIYHKESMSVGKESSLKEYFIIRNRMIFMIKHQKPLKATLFVLYCSCIVIPKRLIILLLKRKPTKFINALINGYFDALKFFIFKKRHIPNRGLKFL